MPDGALGPAAKKLWLAGTLLAGAAVTFANPVDRGGWFLMFLTFLVVGFDRRVVQQRGLLVVMCLVLVMHHVAVLVNAYAFTLPGGGDDAYSFNHYAGSRILSRMTLQIGMYFYVNFLALFHIFGGDSDLTGGQVSVMAFLFSSLVFVRIADLLGAGRYAAWLLLAFGALPSMLIFSSLTLREPIELLCLVTGVYGGLRTFLRPAWWTVPVCAGSLLLMGLFHQLLLVYALVAAAVMFVVPLPGRAGASRRTVLAVSGMAIAAAAVVLVIGLVRTPSGDNYLRMARGNPIHELVEYRSATNESQPRTAYSVELSDASAPKFIASAVLVYAHFLFAPFPSQVAGVQDAYACAEGLMRAGLLVVSLLALYLATGERRRALLVLLLLYGAMTAMWAMGTTNYGQALRHHVLSNWMLLLAGGPLLLSWLEGLWQGRRP